MNNLNEAFENELLFQYMRDPQSVTPQWREYFERINGTSVIVTQSEPSSNGTSQNYSSTSAANNTPNTGKTVSQDTNHGEIKLLANESLEPMNSITSKIADNMEESLLVPTATSFRTIPVKALDENRRIINRFLEKQGKSKVSFSQILLWAIVKALTKYPRMNDSFERQDGKPIRKVKKSVNIGVAVDMTRKDGTRLLMVPNIKDAQNMQFAQFIQSIEDLIAKTRNSKLSLDDMEGTTVTLTNPGMMGTNASAPRLMKGQGLIIAAGSLDYPVEFLAVRSDLINQMAVSKVITITSTYDHRIIQGAESAEFLLYFHKLLIGENYFYDQIYASLKIPYAPIKWENDSNNKAKSLASLEKSTFVMQLINAFRVRGHLMANINPLGADSYAHPELDPAHYGLNIWDLDREFPVERYWGSDSMNLRSILDLLRDSYTGSTGVEFMHIADSNKKDWIKTKIETTRNKVAFNKEHKVRIFKKLIEAESFENYLHTKFVGHKRFSLEGSESIIVILDRIFEDSAESEIDSLVLGMAHRGRLNVLVNNIGKRLENVFEEFEGNYGHEHDDGSGDVKYHLGDDSVYTNINGKQVNVKLTPNPSHLEIINPVVEGVARAIEAEMGDSSFSKAMPILIHGDAAFAGQGIGQEVFNMMNLDGYKTGGTIHIVINNQIGFTTTPEFSRSSTYCSDVAKMLHIPVLHVNGNDPEAVCAAGIFAVEYRNLFKDDVVIDILSYRKYGHNEGDEPSYTQPLLYKKIRQMVPVREIYQNELIKTKVLTSEETTELIKEYKAKLDKAFETRKENVVMKKLVDEGKFGQTLKDTQTNITGEWVTKIIDAITHYPDYFNANPKVIGGLKKRKEMIQTGEAAIDWATAEALAFGSLLLEGKDVRLSGEDSQRGTFSQRHAVLIDYSNENTYVPLNHIQEQQGKIKIHDSPLSELGVLGFDYGFSVQAKKTLTLWEAQFGDFVNMAQPITDQFIVCSEVKWGQTSNLVMLLPHGQDGQGPEHSSARLERFLQLCADENIIVCNFTSPAQYFHALRRQMMLYSKMPLVLMTPKAMLRHPLAVSRVRDFTDYTFRHLIDDVDSTDSNQISRVILCTGKVYYELLGAKREQKLNHIAILRIEQLYPLHKELLVKLLNKYSNAREILWVQEEPKNQGAWSYIASELIEALGGNKRVHYVGRAAAAATAPGSQKVHNAEQANIINTAMNGTF